MLNKEKESELGRILEEDAYCKCHFNLNSNGAL